MSLFKFIKKKYSKSAKSGELDPRGSRSNVELLILFIAITDERTGALC